nr:DUF4349 domain-containing protein [Ardenticatena sp.]
MKRLSLVFLLVVLTVLTACGNAERSAYEEVEADMGMAQSVPAAPAVEEAPAEMGMAREKAFVAGEEGVGERADLLIFDRKIIKTGVMTLEVEDVFDALDQITLLTTHYGGYMVSSRTWYEGEDAYAQLTFAVPVDQFEQAVAQTRRLGKVLNEQTTSEDVTDQYVDLEARIQNLEATAARIRAFLDEAQTVEEALRVNAELSRVEAELERLKGQRNVLEKRTAFSTLQVTLQPVVATPVVEENGWSPAKTLREAWRTLLHLGQGVLDAAIWLIVVGGPIALVVGTLALVAWRGMRALWRLGRARRPASSSIHPPVAE